MTMRTAYETIEPATETGPAGESSVNAGANRSQKSASAFRTISEVADDLGVQQHVLRFWETKFSQVRPLKRGGGRRYYRPEDVILLKRIHQLLYTEGYTIKGVQKLLKEQGRSHIVAEATALQAANAPQSGAAARAPAPAAASQRPLDGRQRQVLEAMLAELKDLRSLVKSAG